MGTRATPWLIFACSLAASVGHAQFDNQADAQAACDSVPPFTNECTTPCDCFPTTNCSGGCVECGTCGNNDVINCGVATSSWCTPPECTEDIDCDDGIACTVDTCQAGSCDNAVDEQQCTCTAGAPPSVTVAFNPPALDGTIACPPMLGGDRLGASGQLSGEVTVQEPSCGNDCAPSASAELQFELDVGACVRDVTLSGTATYDYTAALCPVCDAADCELSCGATGCETRAASGAVGATVSGFLGARMKPPANPGPIVVGGRCGATMSVGVDLTYAGSATTDTGACTACEGCELTELGGTLSGQVAATCMMSLDGPGFTFEFGCANCAAVTLSDTAATQLQSGACGDQDCVLNRADSALKVKTPVIEAGLLWWRVPTECEYSFTLCEEANTCGTCTCGGDLCAEATSGGGCTVAGLGVPSP